MVTIAKGSTTGMFTVETADTTDENNQTFTVTLSLAFPPALVELAADPTARGTIEDDDDPPTLTVNVPDQRHHQRAGKVPGRQRVSMSCLSPVNNKCSHR